MPEKIIFKVIRGGLQDEEFVFEESGLCLVGRSSDSLLRIPKEKDMRISRRHCLLILDPPSIRIRDLGSRNGTYVNGDRLDAGTIGDNPAKEMSVDRALRHGDKVMLGDTVFLVEIPEAAKNEAPKKGKLPPGTKVIELKKPPERKLGKVVKGRPVDTGFFAPATPMPPTATTPKTEAIPRFSPPDDSMEQTLLAQEPPTAMRRAPVEPVEPPQHKKPMATLTLKAKKSGSASPAPAKPAPGAPTILKAKRVGAPQPGEAAPKPLKAKIVGRKTSSDSSVDKPSGDGANLADGAAMSESHKRAPRPGGKRATKFRIKKGPK